MRVIVESHIPFIKGHLEAAGHEVIYLDPEAITADAVKDADALVIRTRTRCDAALLEGSRVSRIATATIGTDHIDLGYCRRNGIVVNNAPGCNAPAVAQYVLSAVLAAGFGPGATIGIVGVGHVGSIVDRWARANGYRTLLCDPPLGLPASLGQIAAEADVVTFHTPLDATTRHMAGRDLFDACRRSPMVINAARGPVTDTRALIDALGSGRLSTAAIDCWEGEPTINLSLLDMAFIATPHIAGYSLEGKRRATAMALHAIDPELSVSLDPVAEAPTLDSIAASYSPLADTAALKNAPLDFESLRNHYDYRPDPR